MSIFRLFFSLVFMLIYVYFFNLQKSALSFTMITIQTIFVFQLPVQQVFAGCFPGTLKYLLPGICNYFFIKMCNTWVIRNKYKIYEINPFPITDKKLRCMKNVQIRSFLVLIFQYLHWVRGFTKNYLDLAQNGKTRARKKVFLNWWYFNLPRAVWNYYFLSCNLLNSILAFNKVFGKMVSFKHLVDSCRTEVYSEPC